MRELQKWDLFPLSFAVPLIFVVGYEYDAISRDLLKRRAPGRVVSPETVKHTISVSLSQSHQIIYNLYQSKDMETHIEDKNVITGGESGVGEVDAIQEPYVGMVFETDKAVKAFYDEYARRKGFFTRIISSRKSDRDGSLISRRLACNKEGFNVNRQKPGGVRVRKRESIRGGCKAMIKVTREKPGRWVIKTFEKDHNHGLVISSDKARPAPDDKDRRIRELSSELNRTNQQLAACQEQLQTVLAYIEEHNQGVSKAVENAVRNISEVESDDIMYCKGEFGKISHSFGIR
ncbi:hypothetical protein Q3G72_019140 [Acer saccharum]|nr:hypothetical protein Q3G72_019140 [Acer saccharum]